MTLEEILAQVQMGTLSPKAAENLIRQDGYKEMDYAKLDTGRFLNACMRKKEKCWEQELPRHSMS